MRWPALRAALLAAAIGIAGCGHGGRTMGRASFGETIPIAGARAAGGASPVTIEGSMIEKCPVAGCWFILRDRTGAMKVDTKAAGFAVVDVPLRTRIRVAGRVREEGTEPILEADGLSY